MKEHTITAPYIPNPDARGNICRGDLDVFEQLAFDGSSEEEKDPVIDKSLNEKVSGWGGWERSPRRRQRCHRSAY